MMLRLGSRGGAVVSLQKDLNALADARTIKLASRLEIDGLFGEKTEAAVAKKRGKSMTWWRAVPRNARCWKKSPLNFAK
jgi:peptidoglycan hydrolase-like protein with peptidoglycan-binding domain